MAETEHEESAVLSGVGHAVTAPAAAGLSFVDDTKLHPDFRRLKGNKMYFVEHCNFFECNGARPEGRIAAITPGAFFVIDFLGVMERATPYELITDVYQKKSKDKRLLNFSSTEYHMLLKIPSEMDCHISFQSASALQKCMAVLVTLLETHRGGAFHVKDVPPEKEIELYCNDQRPAGYYSPREVAEINRQRIFLEAYIRGAKKEAGDLQEQVQQARVRLAAHENTIEALKQKGVDERSIRQRKGKIEASLARLHHDVSQKHEECEDVLITVKTLQEELIAADANKKALVDEAVTEMMAKEKKRHDDAVALRRRMQQKEKAALEEMIAGYKKELLRAHNGDAKIRGAEERNAAALGELERDLEVVFRLEKFLATVNGELGVCGDQMNAWNAKKQALISTREKKNISSPTAAIAGVERDGTLDDLMLGSPVSPAAAAAAAAAATTTDAAAAAAIGDPVSPHPDDDDLL